jgi:thiol-disulfide isomerase/thioredoxin
MRSAKRTFMKKIISGGSVFTFSCLMLPVLLQSAEAARESAKEKKIDHVKVKMKDLVDTHISAHKGKVVVIYVWAFWHAPSRHEFVKFAHMHAKYADKGLVYMSVDLGLNEDLKKKSLDFLQDKKAVFGNYWLEDGLEAAQKHWQFEPIPVVVIYGRDGKLAKIFTNDDLNSVPYTYKDAEEFVEKKLLEK